MPLLDHFRLPRLTKAAAPPPVASIPPEPATRLDRMVARQKCVRMSTEMERRIQAMEQEYSEPLYDAKAYGSPTSGASED